MLCSLKKLYTGISLESTLHTFQPIHFFHFTSLLVRLFMVINSCALQPQMSHSLTFPSQLSSQSCSFHRCSIVPCSFTCSFPHSPPPSVYVCTLQSQDALTIFPAYYNNALLIWYMIHIIHKFMLEWREGHDVSYESGTCGLAECSWCDRCVYVKHIII